MEVKELKELEVLKNSLENYNKILQKKVNSDSFEELPDLIKGILLENVKVSSSLIEKTNSEIQTVIENKTNSKLHQE